MGSGLGLLDFTKLGRPDNAVSQLRICSLFGPIIKIVGKQFLGVKNEKNPMETTGIRV